jgi:hypothetical protein
MVDFHYILEIEHNNRPNEAQHVLQVKDFDKSANSMKQNNKYKKRCHGAYDTTEEK